MSQKVFLDTCVLYPIYLCDSLLRLAQQSTYVPFWSADVLRELRGALIRGGLPADRAERRIRRMTLSFPGSTVTGYGSLINKMTNEPGDRHVLAAAIRSRAELVVTFNMRDFPTAALRPHRITAVHPDQFLTSLYKTSPEVVVSVLQAQVAAYQRLPDTVSGLLDILKRTGVPKFVTQVRDHLPQ